MSAVVLPVKTCVSTCRFEVHCDVYWRVDWRDSLVTQGKEIRVQWSCHSKHASQLVGMKCTVVPTGGWTEIVAL